MKRKNNRTLNFFLILTSFFFALLLSDNANAELRLCNQTTSQVGVSIGFKNKDNWVTEGWWAIKANGCETLIVKPLEARYYYVFAVDYDQGGAWGGPAFMCTYKNKFTIVGIQDCVKRGYEKTGFYEIDTNDERSWTVQLSTPGQ